MNRLFIESLEKERGLQNFEVLGRGGMGVVYKAWEESSQRYVAVKSLIDEEGNFDRGYSEARFGSEISILTKLRHSAIVTVYYAGVVSKTGEPYYVMEYIEGKDLSALIKERKRQRTPFSIEETASLLGSIASALDYLHLGLPGKIIHRDVKPANILVPDGGGYEAKALLTDFGISLMAEATRFTSYDILHGTEGYVAPELYREVRHQGDNNVHYFPEDSSDNYALAVIAFEMLTLVSFKDTIPSEEWRGDRSFPDWDSLNFADNSPRIRHALEQIFRKAFDPIPGKRYGTASEFIEALVSIQRYFSAPHSRPSEAYSDSNKETMAYTVGNYVSPSAASTVDKRKIPFIPLILFIFIIFMLIIGAGYFFVRYPSWSAPDQKIASAFPSLISSRENKEGWRGMTCTSSQPRDGEEARIICSGSAMRIAAVDFGSKDTRDQYIPEDIGDNYTTLESNSCTVMSVPIDSGNEPTFALIPNDRAQRFAVLISGTEAEEEQLKMPVC